MYHQN